MGFMRFMFSFLFIVLVAALLILYWFVPYRNIQLNAVPEQFEGNYNFSVEDFGNQEMQFYPKLRYPESEISYRIVDCPVGKEYDMKRGFEVLEEKTILDFYPVEQEERIRISCSQKRKIDKEYFIAGEGGPTEIIKTDNFNVILKGEILLLDESKCTEPNIAIHELLHALGFKHSDNPNNIMYNVTKCHQTIGDDTINTINTLYSVQGYSDLQIKNVSAKIEGKYLHTNITITNNGLKKSEGFNLVVSTDKGVIKEIPVDDLEIGHGKNFFWKNIWIKEREFDYIKYELKSSQQELNKENNKIKLEIKE
ncbi:MAG: matrixin family metalloprotease [Minisyncoccales bacterium]